MKSRTKPEDMQTIFLIKQGEIGRQTAGELSRKLARMLNNNPEFYAAVDKMVQERAKQNAKPEQAQTTTA